ncbi:MAG: hypothetical protein A3J74_01635 [Elusimicrobia bacterium RIFCSPHIGHO2_02_FULL_57_9]|nr:MAG: hypothetical protein A3J74_01635 [Elusimicrobia bacterium RIFCSPHIGHO2_02_FULL_57_9]
MLLFAAPIAIIIFLLVLLRHEDQAPDHTAAGTVQGEAFIGHYGYVVHLPKNYMAVQEFKDKKKTRETVYFCKTGTDPTNLLDEGIFGPLGIVRLEARPNELPPDTGLEALERLVTAGSRQRGDKFTVKNLPISSLQGIQINYEAPFPRVEAYVLGQNVLYYFMAGQDDEVYREIVLSLRDSHSEG